MTKAQILTFVKKHSPISNISVAYFTNTEMDGWTANVEYKKRNGKIVEATVEINDRDFKHLKPIFQRSVLLHELGHCVSPHRSKVQREYGAYIWALEKAARNNWTAVSQQLLRNIEEMTLMNWHEERGKYRAHILAARKLMKYIHKRIGLKECASCNKTHMSNVEIKNFIKKHSDNPNIKVLHRNRKKSVFGYNYLAAVSPDDSCLLLTDRFHASGCTIQKATLLHELGHIACGVSEYKSHKWAIKKAVKENLHEVSDALVKQAVEWSKYKWNDSSGWDRSYLLAGRKLVREMKAGKL